MVTVGDSFSHVDIYVLNVYLHFNVVENVFLLKIWTSFFLANISDHSSAGQPGKS